MNVQQIYPFVPLFKRLLTTESTTPTEEEAQSPVHLAHTAKSNDVNQLGETIIALIFYNQREWFQREDDWVAECLAEWADTELERLFNSALKADASQTELEGFIESFGRIVDRWRIESEQAQPQQNPDYDPANPVEGTQYFKYAKLPGTEEFQWLYASTADSADWQTMQDRYNAYEQLIDAQAPARESAEIIEPYGDYFMKAVDGTWRYGRTRESENWYDDYQVMLSAENLIPAAPAAPVPEPAPETEAEAATATEEIREYGDHFIKLVEGAWRYGCTRESENWYADYEDMLRAEGLAPEAPVSVAETAEELEELLQPSAEEARMLGPEGLAELDEVGAEFADLFNEAQQDLEISRLAALLSDEDRALAAVEIADLISEPR
jgi:hypothetical protein